jgi:bacterioferritin
LDLLNGVRGTTVGRSAFHASKLAVERAYKRVSRVWDWTGGGIRRAADLRCRFNRDYHLDANHEHGTKGALMRAKEGIIDRLNALLAHELTATDQYVLHTEMARNWGYEKIGAKFWALALDEMKDAQNLIRHIFYLEGMPKMQRTGPIQTADGVPQLLEINLQRERQVVEALAEAIPHCAQVGDFTTRGMFEEMIKEEEGHVDWFETQLETISQIGVENYLTQQLG